ncbi:hypothetical protein PBY51_006021 [Eleginops maclovinus]|uniref:SEA domain-containing protein n=1 Tax=Eleginops maclovinus TaxID=56733 RepID=A0AAN7WVY7_ELEMC|nr:hypothetical protein PBY51_006021 [Eleginops maclovinus]
MGSAPILPILLMFLGAIKLAGSSTTTADGSTLTSSSPSSIGSTTNELNNPNSTQYKTLARLIVSVCDLIYRRKFGFIFIRTYIRGFRGVVARTRMENIQAEVGLVFNNTVSPAQIPKDDVVIATLAEAVNTPNSLNLTIVPNSIQIIGSPTKAPTTPVTTAKTPATTAAEKLTKRRLTFRSAGEIFKNDLLNPSSSAFVNRATLIKQTLEPNYQKAFSSFRFLNVIMFRNGSIINTMDLQFASTSVPNGTQIADVLIGAASNITAFNIETTSISVDGIQVSHGVKHRISVLTATLLVLLSWLLPRLH